MIDISYLFAIMDIGKCLLREPLACYYLLVIGSKQVGGIIANSD